MTKVKIEANEPLNKKEILAPRELKSCLLTVSIEKDQLINFVEYHYGDQNWKIDFDKIRTSDDGTIEVTMISTGQEGKQRKVYLDPVIHSCHLVKSVDPSLNLDRLVLDREMPIWINNLGLKTQPKKIKIYFHLKTWVSKLARYIGPIGFTKIDLSDNLIFIERFVVESYLRHLFEYLGINSAISGNFNSSYESVSFKSGCLDGDIYPEEDFLEDIFIFTGLLDQWSELEKHKLLPMKDATIDVNSVGIKVWF